MMDHRKDGAGRLLAMMGHSEDGAGRLLAMITQRTGLGGY